MALIACPECAREVSEKAANCPQCGYAIAGATPAAFKDGSAYVTNQGTSKSLKLQGLLAGILFAISLVMTFSSGNPETGYPAGWPLLAFASFVWYCVVRFLKWWRHA